MQQSHQVRDGVWVAELTDLLDLSGWPPWMRVIVRKERPTPAPSLAGAPDQLPYIAASGG